MVSACITALYHRKRGTFRRDGAVEESKRPLYSIPGSWGCLGNGMLYVQRMHGSRRGRKGINANSHRPGAQYIVCTARLVCKLLSCNRRTGWDGIFKLRIYVLANGVHHRFKFSAVPRAEAEESTLYLHHHPYLQTRCNMIEGATE